MKEKDLPVFILCGGKGTRISEESIKKPKPMVEINGKPIMLHIIEYYMKFGFRKFILCTGYKCEIINDYFINFFYKNSDFSVNLSNGKVIPLNATNYPEDLTVTCCFTGIESMTGARIKRATQKYLLDKEKHFAVTYGDGLCNVNLSNELNSHLESKKLATVLAVNPPSRFGEFVKEGSTFEFIEKPHKFNTFINGGYFFFRREFINRLDDNEGLILEQLPLVNLAKDNQLNVFPHTNFWQCMDTLRDKNVLDKLAETNSAPWLK